MVSTTILSSTTVDCTLIIMFLEQQISILPAFWMTVYFVKLPHTNHTH